MKKAIALFLAAMLAAAVQAAPRPPAFHRHHGPRPPAVRCVPRPPVHHVPYVYHRPPPMHHAAVGFTLAAPFVRPLPVQVWVPGTWVVELDTRGILVRRWIPGHYVWR